MFQPPSSPPVGVGGDFSPRSVAWPNQRLVALTTIGLAWNPVKLLRPKC